MGLREEGELHGTETLLMAKKSEDVSLKEISPNSLFNNFFL